MELAVSVESRQIWRRLAWLAVYASAMGLLEAICVIYLRRLCPVETNYPIPPLERMQIEIIREACTIVMLAAVAWLAGINLRSRLACFFCAFGVWDILYYIGLAWLAGWPKSVLDWDCLFLIPKPWYGPVLVPVLISFYFVAGCWFLHLRELRNAPLRLSGPELALQLLGFLVWYWSFVKDAERISSHGYAGIRYAWEWFAVGLILGVVGLWLAGRSRPTTIAASPHPTRPP